VDRWNEMHRSDQLIAAGSLVVLVSLFLPWFGYDVSVGGFSVSGSVDGFHSWGWITFIALLAVIGLYVVRNFASDAVKLPDLPFEDGVAYLALAVLEALGALLFWAAYHGDTIEGVGWGIKFGLIVALVGAVITGAGGYLKRTEPAATGGGSSTWQTSPPSAPYGAPPPPAAPPPPPAPPSSSAPPGSPPPPPYNPPPPPASGG